MRGLAAALAVLAASAAAAAARADDAGAPAAGAGGSVRGCVETIPPGAARPTVIDSFPDRGTSGWAETLVVHVEHGKGETPLPGGLELQTASEVAKDLRAEGWVVPDQDGGAAARMTTAPPDPKTGRVKTTIEIPLLALPPEPGRHLMSLPPLPIAVARASGEIATVCTRAHRIVVDDPIASVPDPQPRPNPRPLAQREEWTELERALQIAAAAAAAGVLAFWLVWRWLRRPKPVPPPPPPRPAWEIALERLDEVRHAGLLATRRYVEYFDRTTDALRQYLGARYGFDGLESTTDEIVAALGKADLAGASLPEIATLLSGSDLVKFAKSTPTDEECVAALDTAERIVRATMPRAPAPAAAPAGEATA